MEQLTLTQLMQLVEEKDNKKITKILLKFKNQWNQLMEENKKLNQKIRLFGLDLRGQDLKGVDLSDTLIEDSDFSESDLSEADMSNAAISGSDFSGANMSGSNMYRSRITQTRMVSANLYQANTSEMAWTGSVDLFGVYINSQEDEELYRTHPNITKRGFLNAQAYEHAFEHGEDIHEYD